MRTHFAWAAASWTDDVLPLNKATFTLRVLDGLRSFKDKTLVNWGNVEFEMSPSTPIPFVFPILSLRFR